MNELEIIRYPQMGGLNIFFDTVDYRAPHAHPEWELILVLENHLSVTWGQQSYPARPGDLVLFSPNSLHEFHKVGESCTFLCIQLETRTLAAVFPQIEHMTADSLFPRDFLSEEDYCAAVEVVKDIMGAYLRRESCYQLYCMGQGCLLLYGLLAKMPCHTLSAGEVSSRDKSNARLKRLIRFVDENYMHKIRLSDFAAAEGCSVSYLSHFVKDTLNQTFQEYVNGVRFNCACRLMAGGARKMLDVCVASGFSDYRYFSRTFQQRVGMTPEEYSRLADRPEQGSGSIKHSLHSLERFYTREQSSLLLQKYL